MFKNATALETAARIDTVVMDKTGTLTRGELRRTRPPISPAPTVRLKNRSFTIVAEVENPHGDVEGTIVTLGGETGGYALLVMENHPTFQYNWLDRERYTITATEPLPTGACTIRFDFAYDGGGPGKGGTGTLSVNGQKVGEGRIAKTVPVDFSTDDTFDIGEDWGTPVSSAYKPPFKFTCISGNRDRGSQMTR